MSFGFFLSPNGKEEEDKRKRICDLSYRARCEDFME